MHDLSIKRITLNFVKQNLHGKEHDLVDKTLFRLFKLYMLIKTTQVMQLIINFTPSSEMKYKLDSMPSLRKDKASQQLQLLKILVLVYD